MPYLFKDLIVTLVPQGSGAESGSGCAACSDAGSATVGSCTSECAVDCGDSGEIIEIDPYSFIDPPYQLELQRLLVFALAKADVKVSQGTPVPVLEKQMRPTTVAEVDTLTRQLQEALQELQALRRQLGG